MAQGPLSSVMMTASAGLLPVNSSDPAIGAALSIPSNLTSAVNSYESLAVVTQYTGIISLAQSSNVANSTLHSLQTLANSSFPGVTNVIPSGYDLSDIAPGNVFAGGLSNLITSMANNILGGGDLTRFAQIYSASQGYAGLTNQFINSNLNANTIASTFGPTTGGMDNVTTGGWNQVTQAYGAFGQDLTNLGRLINPKDLAVLGSPAALLKQVAAEGGLFPAIVNVFTQAGITTSQLGAISAGNIGEIDDSTNKLIYQAMTRITGNNLQQVCAVLGVKLPVGDATLLPYTEGEDFAFSSALQRLKNARPGGLPRTTTASSPNTINTMADLLNPVKIFPNSFATLTMPTPDGLRAIYATTAGAVNTNLEQYLTTTPSTLPAVGRPVTVEIITI